MDVPLMEVYDRLFAAYGPQQWWPGESPFEVLIGAILTQNTSWKNVERAIENLRRCDLVEPRALYAVPAEELEELIRPAGYYRVKTRRLRNLLSLLVQRYGGSLERMFQTRPEQLREELLQVSGIGPETADSILLYAGELPVFVVDTYTYRVLARHGWIDFDAGYDEIQELFQRGLAAYPKEAAAKAALYNEYHALFVRVGHLHCRKAPRCEGCPLSALLPRGGAREPE